MFDFNPTDYVVTYASRGYVHIPLGLTHEFHRLMTRQVDELEEAARLKDFAIGDKQQSLYSLPDSGDYYGELLDAVAAVSGVDRKRLLLSERHVKAYDQNAAPEPNAHKDRYASEISVGLSVRVAAESKLVFYPHDDVSVNQFNSAAEFRASLGRERLPEVILKSARRIEIKDYARDVFMFRGNAIWHLRSKPAGTTMVYLKLNSFACDPLGEDPLTPDALRRSKQLATLPDGELLRALPTLGRRVDYVERRFDREWNEIAGVVLWNEKSQTIDADEFALIKAMNGDRDVAAVLRAIALRTPADVLVTKLRRLATLAIVDLAPDRAAVAPVFPVVTAGSLVSSPSWSAAM